MTKIFKTLAVLLIIFGGSCKESKGESVDDIIDNDEDKFLFTRAEPGNGLGIVTKIIAHIHRPVNKTTETWRLNREFTPTEVVTVLNSMCSEELIERKIKWSNCQLDSEGLTAELSWGIPEPKNKTLQYLQLSFKPFYQEEYNGGKKERCILDLANNPAYFLFETFSKVPSNSSFPRTVEESVDTVHQHQLGRFGPEFLSVYGHSIDEDAIYNFSMQDYYERSQLYECLLAIGSSESVSVIKNKCLFECKGGSGVQQASIHNEL